MTGSNMWMAAQVRRKFQQDLLQTGSGMSHVWVHSQIQESLADTQHAVFVSAWTPQPNWLIKLKALAA